MAVEESSPSSQEIREPHAQAVPDANSTDGPATPCSVDTLDLVFAVDCTGSMGTYIAAAQANIKNIVQEISREEAVNVRFGLVCYRDHPPQDSSYVTRVYGFTSDVEAMKASVDSMQAQGGGDGPEAMADGLHEVLHMHWRQDAVKVAVLIADAPPHGLGEAGDGFPNGCPDGHDPLAIARECANRGITIYAVGCEPALSSYRAAKDLLISLSELTDGQALVLESASVLARVILGSAQEEIGLTRLQRQVQDQVAAMAAQGRSEEELVSHWHRELQARGVVTKQMRVDSGRVSSSERSKAIAQADSLEQARQRLAVLAPIASESEDDDRPGSWSKTSGCAPACLAAAMPRGSFARSSSRTLDDCCSEGGGGAAAASSSSSSVTVCEVVAEAVSADQVRRLVGKVSKQSTASLFPRP